MASMIRTGVRALRARGGGGPDGAHAIDLDDGTAVFGHAVLLAIGRQVPLAGLGLENLGLDISKERPWPADGRLRIADGLYVIGDPAGPEMHTHTAHYQGETAIRMALGDDIRPDYRALPRCTYTDPEAAFIGVSLEQAREVGLRRVRTRGGPGHVARRDTCPRRRATSRSWWTERRAACVGVAIAGPGATEAIHEAVLAIKTQIPIGVLADTIHAFPTTARVMGGLFVEAGRVLAGRATPTR